eukprot:TRINITY_DN3838_c0_g1_i1.p1 TRINITY_DN3838_c0_g1~~TRINITY_DN3838_c0_g1_i1.p1  ORF type:complete len:580 (+),score=192.77 TRINITY_DN3838_c0_g1_i1:83-1822(+)
MSQPASPAPVMPPRPSAFSTPGTPAAAAPPPRASFTQAEGQRPQPHAVAPEGVSPHVSPTHLPIMSPSQASAPAAAAARRPSDLPPTSPAPSDRWRSPSPHSDTPSMRRASQPQHSTSPASPAQSSGRRPSAHVSQPPEEAAIRQQPSSAMSPTYYQPPSPAAQASGRRLSTASPEGSMRRVSQQQLEPAVASPIYSRPASPFETSLQASPRPEEAAAMRRASVQQQQQQQQPQRLAVSPVHSGAGSVPRSPVCSQRGAQTPLTGPRATLSAGGAGSFVESTYESPVAPLGGAAERGVMFPAASASVLGGSRRRSRSGSQGSVPAAAAHDVLSLGVPATPLDAGEPGAAAMEQRLCEYEKRVESLQRLLQSHTAAHDAAMRTLRHEKAALQERLAKAADESRVLKLEVEARDAKVEALLAQLGAAERRRAAEAPEDKEKPPGMKRVYSKKHSMRRAPTLETSAPDGCTGADAAHLQAEVQRLQDVLAGVRADAQRGDRATKDYADKLRRAHAAIDLGAENAYAQQKQITQLQTALQVVMSELAAAGGGGGGGAPAAVSAPAHLLPSAAQPVWGHPSSGR